MTSAEDLRLVKLWNFNRSQKELNKGVKKFEIKIDNSVVFAGEMDKGCGNHVFDYEKVIEISSVESNNPCKTSEALAESFVISPRSARSAKIAPRTSAENPMKSSTVIADTNNPVSHDEFSLEELLNQSNGRNSSLSGKLGESPKKPPLFGKSRKQFNKISGIFDSLDVSTNEEFHYQATAASSSRMETDEFGGCDTEFDCNTKLDESWSNIFKFERARSGRKATESRCQLDFVEELPSDSGLDSTSKVSLNSYTSSTPAQSMKALDWTNFVIPELPSGKRLTINILSTWGDKHYVGLNGLELFDNEGKKVKISKIEADPSDINVLPEYCKDPRVVTNLIDNVNNTRDDTHMWLAPFSANRNHFVYLSFTQKCKVAMLRIWNYNKSRVHSSRGVKLVEVALDGNPIFRGEVQRAGELGEDFKETFGDTILFTMDPTILSLVSENDELFLNDYHESVRGEETTRPMTAGDEDDLRPPTVASNQKPAVATWESKSKSDLEIFSAVVPKIHEVQLLFRETWADSYYMGLTGLQLLDAELKPIWLSESNLKAIPSDLNSLPEYSKDVRTVDKLIDGSNLTTDENHMWLIPYTPGSQHSLTISLPPGCDLVAAIDVWNYNKSWEDSFRGVKRVDILLDQEDIFGGDGITLRRAPGHVCYDFRQRIDLRNRELHPESSDPECPCGFIYTLMIQSSQNDLYYVGLDGLEVLDEGGRKVSLSTTQIDAYPRSINELGNVKSDIRTPEKLVDGVNNSKDGSHSWLAPIFPNVTNKIYILFDRPQSVSKIRIWNYSKTPSRGVKEIAVLVDDLIHYQGVLKSAVNVARGILPGMDADVQFQTINLKDFSAEEQEVTSDVAFPGSDSVKVHQTATGSQSQAVSQVNRPKTCVPKK